MNKNRLFIVLIILGIVSCILSCTRKSNLFIVKSESYYSDYNVNNSKVSICCYLTIFNDTNSEETIKLKAIFPNDVNKLIETDTLYAKDDNGNDMIFKLQAKTKKSFDVVLLENMQESTKRATGNFRKL